MQKFYSMLALGGLLAFAGLGIKAYDVTITVSPGEAFTTGTVVTFNAVNTGASSTSAYVWTFDDGTPSVTVIGSPLVTHTFSKSEIFAVTVTIDATAGTDFVLVEAIRPPSPTDPLGVDTSDPSLKDVTNPDSGVGFDLSQSQGGFIMGTINFTPASAALRADSTVTTDFGDGVSGRTGTIVQHRFTNAGVFVMTNVVSQNGSEVGKNRKTLVFSETEINGQHADPNVVDPAIADRKLLFKSMKGKFHFGTGTHAAERAAKATNDTVSVTWGMTLPAGFDITTQTVELAIGNVVDSVPLDKSGKGKPISPSPFKAVHFKFPRPDKGLTRSAKSFPSSVTVEMSMSDLTGSGFDTEGISTRQSLLQKSSGPFSRKIQVATNFAGVSYAGAADVQLLVSKDSAFGTISGRSK